ncbi:MAG TPA: c-type cytochrome [Vicinamibacterales bacterium]|jgi:putative heme-binding domain-containing protein
MLRRTALPAALVLALAAPAAGQSRPSASSGITDAAAGQKIFEAQCAWCHGTDGVGGTGPNLQGKLRHATDLKSIIEIISGGISGTEMPSFRLPLTDRSIRQTAVYVRSLSRAVTRPVAGDARRGAALYDSSGCGSCHVVDGTGGTVGPELTRIGATRGAPYLHDALVKPAASHPPGYLVVRAIGLDGAEVRGVRVNEDVFWILIRDAGGTVHSLEKSKLAKVERQLDSSLMPSYESRFSPAQLDDVVAYLAGLRGDR